MTPAGGGAVAELLAASRDFETAAGRVVALAETSLAVEPSEILGLAGPSGSGKTTLLHLLGLLLRPSSGEVRLEGRETSRVREGVRDAFRREFVGFVYQEAMLVSHLNAVRNVTLARPGLDANRAQQLLTEFGIGQLADRSPAQLSGGEQQRVALARGLAHAPALFLADEPTSNLDDASAGVVVSSISGQAGTGGAVVVASHDPRMLDVCTRVLRLEHGRVLEEAA